MSKAAVYLRVSSKSQKVASQKRGIQQYLDGNKITVPADRWYVDSGLSGKDLNRPYLKKLQTAIFNGDVDTVILYKLDRLSRSIRDGIVLLHEWIAERNVRVIIVTMEIDLRGALGQTVAALLLGLAQMEREHLRERQADGIGAAKESCGRCSTPKNNVPMVDGRCPRCRGMEVRTWGGSRPGRRKADPARARKLADKGLTQVEIGRSLGISRSTVIRLLA